MRSACCCTCCSAARTRRPRRPTRRWSGCARWSTPSRRGCPTPRRAPTRRPHSRGARRLLARALRGDLDNIVAKALKKAPAERYPTVGRVRRRPAPLSAPRAGQRARRLARRTAPPSSCGATASAVGAASVTVLALVAGVIGTTWQAIEARRERDEALFQAERALAKGSVFNLMLGSLGDANQPLTQRELLDRSRAVGREAVRPRSAHRRSTCCCRSPDSTCRSATSTASSR